MLKICANKNISTVHALDAYASYKKTPQSTKHSNICGIQLSDVDEPVDMRCRLQTYDADCSSGTF